MSVDTKFRTNKEVDLIEVKFTLEKSLGVEATMEAKDRAGAIDYARSFFTYNGEKRTLWVFKNLPDTKNEHNPSFDTYFSLGAWGHNEEIIRKIAPYFGGWLDLNDCDDKPDEFIEPTPELSEHPLTDTEHLYISIAKNCGVADADKVLRYIMNHKALILSTDFGLDKNQVR